jgi:putative ubiquitin-RnfH superfamily antitoxin RatB of RatAB toxin-antitoxin module
MKGSTEIEFDLTSSVKGFVVAQQHALSPKENQDSSPTEATASVGTPNSETQQERGHSHGLVIDTDLHTEHSALRREITVEKSDIQTQEQKGKRLIVVRDELDDPSIRAKDIVQGKLATSRTQRGQQQEVEESAAAAQEVTKEMFLQMLLEGPFRMKEVELDGVPEWILVEDVMAEIQDEDDVEVLDESAADPREDRRKIPIQKRTRLAGKFRLQHAKITNPRSKRPGHSTFSGGVLMKGSGKVVFEGDEE